LFTPSHLGSESRTPSPPRRESLQTNSTLKHLEAHADLTVSRLLRTHTEPPTKRNDTLHAPHKTPPALSNRRPHHPTAARPRPAPNKGRFHPGSAKTQNTQTQVVIWKRSKVQGAKRGPRGTSQLERGTGNRAEPKRKRKVSTPRKRRKGRRNPNPEKRQHTQRATPVILWDRNSTRCARGEHVPRGHLRSKIR
jgi:hypothetical protein